MSRLFSALVFLAVGLFGGCSTPYAPPVVANGSPEFPGLVTLLEKSGGRPVDVVMVHGMCTHEVSWGYDAINRLVRAISANTNVEIFAYAPSVERVGKIDVISTDVLMPSGSLRLSALVWSPWTKTLKEELAFDATGVPTDCTAPGVCTPTRAQLNGYLKDGLFNDCLVDALIYQGQSHKAILQNMTAVVAKVLGGLGENKVALKPGPLVLISHSLGSKLAMDALLELSSAESLTPRVRSSVERLALVFMGANQLPLLRLSEQSASDVAPSHVAAPVPPVRDSLQRLLDLKRAQARAPEPDGSEKPYESFSINIVAFSDPNDLLSYTLRPSRYSGPGVSVSDILVSNSSTFLGLIARPDSAHTDYDENDDVYSLIVCGHQKDKRCE